ncbi:MAG: CDP-diacylglycerol--glycerol-3-phosphate 3-phosphatidyltransferase [Deltaproteobacteria bacterium]|jgi:CDP-diacylglycerol--glycerol-3-phosphate 3-phosphatidyltransferase|nr:CDP-diacylglycerol--glycerol-3-phosphate 3-phosphatidyltransferase [Deltaproteobacteria bacterium]
MKNRLRALVTWSGLPNVITLTRLVAIPIIATVLSVWGQTAGPVLNAFVALVYLIAALSDLLDGHLARAYGHESNLGRFLDPLADKLLVASAMIMLIPLGRVPAWVAFLVVAREISVTALRAIAMEKNLVIAASPQGKRKTLAQNIAMFCLLWNGELIWADTVAVGEVILYVALFVTYWSAYLYFRDFFMAAKLLRGEAKSESLSETVLNANTVISTEQNQEITINPTLNDNRQDGLINNPKDPPNPKTLEG